MTTSVIGDLDGDGDLDIATGAYLDDDGGTDRGAIWVLNMNGAGVLPIELISFDGTVQNDNIKLSWVTAAEINNDYFTVERSLNGIDFDEIALVKGAGNSKNKINYESFDEQPVPGTSFYRLKQTDLDGASTLSDVISITYTNNNLGGINIYPNPVVVGSNLTIQLEGNDAKATVLKLYNANGKVMMQKVIASNSNRAFLSTSLELPNDLAPGLYLLMAENNDNVLGKRKLMVR